MQCCHNAIMTVQITIRNVPEEVRDELKIRAARNRQSMQKFLLNELERITVRPSREEVLERVRARVAASNTSVGSGTIVGMIRDDRER